jgi:hypothetical protein
MKFNCVNYGWKEGNNIVLTTEEDSGGNEGGENSECVNHRLVIAEAYPS